MAPTASTGGMLMSTVLYLGFFFVIMYFLIIRPQKKRDKQVADMQSSIKVAAPNLTIAKASEPVDDEDEYEDDEYEDGEYEDEDEE